MLKFNKKEKIITCIVAAALAAAVSVAMVYLSNKDTLTLRGPMRFSYMGESRELDGKIRMQYRDNTMYLTAEEIDRMDMQGMPLYEIEEDRLILSQIMSYTNPETGRLRKVNYFSSVERADNVCQVRHKGNGAGVTDVNGGYLFDGRNTYIFLEPMTLYCGDDLWEMGPLSCVTVANRKYFHYYNAANGTSGYEVLTDEKVIAVNRNETYELNMSKDLLMPANGKTQMLIPNPEILDLLK